MVEACLFRALMVEACLFGALLGGAGCQYSLGTFGGLQDLPPRLSVRVNRIKNYEAEIIYSASTMRNREESKHPSITAGLQQLGERGYRRSSEGGQGSDRGLCECLGC